MAEMSLSDVLVQLRKELKLAQEKAMNDELQLIVRDIDIELDVATTKEANGKVGFKVWLVEGEAGGGLNHQQTHSLRLRLDPHRKEGVDPKVSGPRKGP